MEHEIISQVVEKLKSAPWFSALGQPVNDERVVQVHSVKAVIAHSESESWEVATLEAFNDLSEERRRLNPNLKAKQWKTIVREINGMVRPIIDEKLQLIQELTSLSKSVGDSVQWNVGAYCDARYCGVESRFFSDVMDWYLAGHLPCGWDGEYPAGKLVVY